MLAVFHFLRVISEIIFTKLTIIDSSSEHTHLVLPNQVRGIDPRMVLGKQFGAVLARAQEDLFASGVDLSVLCHVIDTSFMHSPAVVRGTVLGNFL